MIDRLKLSLLPGKNAEGIVMNILPFNALYQSVNVWSLLKNIFNNLVSQKYCGQFIYLTGKLHYFLKKSSIKYN